MRHPYRRSRLPRLLASTSRPRCSHSRMKSSSNPPLRLRVKNGSGRAGTACPFYPGGLNRSTQHFILEGKDGVWDGTEISSRFYCGREDGVMGSLEAWGVAEGDRTSFWQAVIVDLFSGGSAWWDSSCAAASLQAGIDACGTRGDFQRCYGTSISPVDRQTAWPLTLDGEPGNESQWRL